MPKEHLTETFQMRASPSDLSRWRALAKETNLPLSVYARKKFDDEPVLPPPVPAVNVSLAVRLGNKELQLRRIGNNINQFTKALNSASLTGHQPSGRAILATLNELKTLLSEDRADLKKVSAQLNGISLDFKSDDR